MKRPETTGKKPDQISASLHRYLPLISLVALQPHPPPPLPQFRYFSCAKHVSRRRSTLQNYRPPPAPHSFVPQCSASSSSSITIPPSDGSKTAPSLTQPRSYLASRTPRNPHADAPPRSSISVVCVSQIDGLFPLLPVFHGIGTSTSLGLVGWKGRGWYRELPPCSAYYPADLLELEWIRSANRLEKL